VIFYLSASSYYKNLKKKEGELGILECKKGLPPEYKLEYDNGAVEYNFTDVAESVKKNAVITQTKC
jgi:hypothetical protein